MLLPLDQPLDPELPGSTDRLAPRLGVGSVVVLVPPPVDHVPCVVAPALRDVLPGSPNDCQPLRVPPVEPLLDGGADRPLAGVATTAVSPPRFVAAVRGSPKLCHEGDRAGVAALP